MILYYAYEYSAGKLIKVPVMGKKRITLPSGVFEDYPRPDKFDFQQDDEQGMMRVEGRAVRVMRNSPFKLC